MKTGSGKKLGGVVAYKPYPWTWGGMGIKHYLILVVDGITEEEYAGMIMPLYEYPDGLVKSDGWFDYGLLLGKHRYNIDTIALKSHWKAAFDPELNYQPFDDEKVILNFKSMPNVYDKYNETGVFYGTAPLTERIK